MKKIFYNLWHRFMHRLRIYDGRIYIWFDKGKRPMCGIKCQTCHQIFQIEPAPDDILTPQPKKKSK